MRIIDLALPVAVIGGAWFVAGAGCGLLVAGIATLTAAATGIRSLEGPLRALAVALVAEAVFVTAVSYLAAIVAPHGDFTVTAAIALGVPVLVGLVVWAAGLGRGRRPSAHARGQVRFITAVAVAFLVGALWLENAGLYVAVSWSLSGDSANHLSIAESIVTNNGVTLHQITKYPPVAELLVALTSALPTRAGLAPAGVVLRDAQALAAVQMVAMCGIGLMFAASVWEFLSAARFARNSVATYVLMSAAAAAVLAETVSGVAVAGGFLSALVGLMFNVAAIALTIAVVRSPTPAIMIAIFAAAVVALLTWVVLGIALVALVITALVSYWVHRHPGLRGAGNRRAGLIASVACSVGVVGMLGAVAVRHGSFIATLKLPGGIVPIEPQLLVALVATSGIGALITSGAMRRMFVVPVVVGVATLVVLLVLRAATGSPGLSNYYESKFIWLQLAALAWVPVAFIGCAATAVSGAATRTRYLAVLGLLVSGAVVWSGASQTMPGSRGRLITWIRHGGDFRNQPAMTQLFALSAAGGPVVIWGDGPGVNSPFMNFVSSQIFTAANMHPGSGSVDSGFAFPESRQANYFSYWADRIYPPNWHGQNTSVLCRLLKIESGVVVVVSQRQVAARVQAVCPTLAHRVARYVPLARP